MTHTQCVCEAVHTSVPFQYLNWIHCAVQICTYKHPGTLSRPTSCRRLPRARAVLALMWTQRCAVVVLNTQEQLVANIACMTARGSTVILAHPNPPTHPWYTPCLCAIDVAGCAVLCCVACAACRMRRSLRDCVTRLSCCWVLPTSRRGSHPLSHGLSTGPRWLVAVAVVAGLAAARARSERAAAMPPGPVEV